MRERGLCAAAARTYPGRHSGAIPAQPLRVQWSLVVEDDLFVVPQDDDFLGLLGSKFHARNQLQEKHRDIDPGERREHAPASDPGIDLHELGTPRLVALELHAGRALETQVPRELETEPLHLLIAEHPAF